MTYTRSIVFFKAAISTNFTKYVTLSYTPSSWNRQVSYLTLKLPTCFDLRKRKLLQMKNCKALNINTYKK